MKEKKILVADYSETCNMLTDKYLQDIGISPEHICIVRGGKDVLAKAEQELFDVIILSPYELGVDATQIAYQIKERWNGNAPKIVEYTSGKYGHIRDEIFDEVIFKPIDKEHFT